MVVHQYILTHTEAQRLVQQTDEKFGKKGPWDSVFKIAAVARIALGISKTNAMQRIIWMLEAVLELVANGGLKGDMSLDFMRGTKGGKGMLHLLLYKKDLLEELLKFATKTVQDAAGIGTLRKHLYDFPAWKASSASRAWVGTLHPALGLVATLIEAHLATIFPCVKFLGYPLQFASRERALSSSMKMSPLVVTVPVPPFDSLGFCERAFWSLTASPFFFFLSGAFIRSSTAFAPDRVAGRGAGGRGGG